jgi:basic membrane protein A
MNKKILLLVTIILSLTLVIVGCTSEQPTQTSQTSEQTPEVPVEEIGEEFVVGFIYTSPAGDGGWSTSHDYGRQAVEQELGVKTLYVENVPESQEIENIMRDMISQGAKVIFATSYGYMEYVSNVAAEYPDVVFLHASGYESSDNMINYFGRIYQARYLTGIVAGLKTESNKIGYVGAYPIPEVIRGINAFALGVQSVNPDAEVSVRWTHTWYDPATEKEAAVALLDEGVDVIAQHQDTAGPQQAAEEKGVWSVGYHTDMSMTAPEANMTSAIWDWAPYYVNQVSQVMDGTWTPVNYWGGMEDGVVELAPLTKNAPEGAQEILDEVTASIMSGENKIFVGPLYGQNGDLVVAEGVELTDEELLSMMWFVQGVKGTIE